MAGGGFVGTREVEGPTLLLYKQVLPGSGWHPESLDYSTIIRPQGDHLTISVNTLRFEEGDTLLIN